MASWSFPTFISFHSLLSANILPLCVSFLQIYEEVGRTIVIWASRLGFRYPKLGETIFRMGPLACWSATIIWFAKPKWNSLSSINLHKNHIVTRFSDLCSINKYTCEISSMNTGWMSPMLKQCSGTNLFHLKTVDTSFFFKKAEFELIFNQSLKTFFHCHHLCG